MELVLAALHLSWLGGATTYLTTVASALQRLGHQVTLYSPDAGGTAELVRAQGLRVATAEAALPSACDGVLVQDTVMALELADRYRCAQVFVSHGVSVDLAIPPQLPGVTAAVVAMNDRVAAQARALALEAPVVRLRQPIDIERFRFRGPVRERPQRALLLGNYLRASRRSVVTDACDALGIEWIQVGRESGAVVDEPADAIAGADLVVGYGRSILEAMACGRPAYVCDHTGVDGWVTAESYPALERDGFAGTAFETPANADVVQRDLESYPAASGLANFHLAWRHHNADGHAQSLVELFRQADGAPPRRADSIRELARVVRSQWHSDWRSGELARELELARGRELEAERRAADAERLAGDYRRRLDEVARSRRWRLAQRLFRPLDRARGR